VFFRFQMKDRFVGAARRGSKRLLGRIGHSGNAKIKGVRNG
jgi:hypothetical protein